VHEHSDRQWEGGSSREIWQIILAKVQVARERGYVLPEDW
jgi:hypothetical protein